MNEYTLEMIWNWWVEMQCFPQNGLVSNLLTYVPRPKQSQLKNSLPLWDVAPLSNKLPDLGIKGLYHTRGKVGTSLMITDSSIDFITYDPHGYEHDSRKYDSLHDRHLVQYFKSKKIGKFLKRSGLVDDQNYAKCSVGDMNAFRFYLNRIHSNRVKYEHKRFIDEVNEKRIWKSAQQNVVKHYFKRLNKEINLNKNSKRRIQLANEKRLKELKPYKLLKKWENRLAARAQQAKDNNLVKEELGLRKKKKYEEVLSRGKVLATRRPIMTSVKLRNQQLVKEEMEKKKKLEKEINEKLKAESYLSKKTLAQFNKLELQKQLQIFFGKGKELVHQRQELQLKRQRRMFDQQLQCRKMNKFPAIENKIEQDLISEKQKENIKGGINYIMQVLGAIDKDKPGHKNRFSRTLFQNPILTQVARQLIKRAVYVNLIFFCRYLAIAVINCALTPITSINKQLAVEDYFPAVECLNNAGMRTEMIPNSFELIVNNVKLSEKLVQDLDTSGLKAFLTKKQKLLKTMLENTKRIFYLVKRRAKLLLSVNDPYKDTPYLKKEIIKVGKTMTINEVIEKLVTILTTTDKKRFDTPLSEFGTIANLLAYSKIMYDRKLIQDTCDDPTKIPSPYIWKCALLLHQILQKFQYRDHEKRTNENENAKFKQKKKKKTKVIG